MVSENAEPGLISTFLYEIWFLRILKVKKESPPYRLLARITDDDKNNSLWGCLGGILG